MRARVRSRRRVARRARSGDRRGYELRLRVRLPAARAARRAGARAAARAAARGRARRARRRGARRARSRSARGELLAAALLLQLKTVLDNADGQLARATGRVTALGRYLDSESDLLVERGALRRARLRDRAARGSRSPRSSLLTLVLERRLQPRAALPREQRRRARPAADGCAACSARVYDVVYAPQDRLVERLRRRRPARGGARRAGTLAVLANFGLSTQLAALGVCLAVGRPEAYLWIVARLSRAALRRRSRVAAAGRASARPIPERSMDRRRREPTTSSSCIRRGADGRAAREIAPEDWARYEALRRRDLRRVRDGPRHARHARDAGALPARALRRDRRLRGRPEAPDRVPGRGQRRRTAAPARSSRGRSPSTASASTTRCRSTASRTIGYIADEQIIGISKLTRLVRLYARRFTVQERLGEQIADTLVELVAPRGVAVHLEASHLCTQMRGVEEHSRTVTTFWRGAFETTPSCGASSSTRCALAGDARRRSSCSRSPTGLRAFDLPGRAAALYGGSLGFDGPTLFVNFVETIDGVVALPVAAALEHADRRRQRGRPVRDGAAARLRRRRPVRARDAAGLAAARLDGRTGRIRRPRTRSPSCGGGSARASGPRSRS